MRKKILGTLLIGSVLSLSLLNLSEPTFGRSLEAVAKKANTQVTKIAQSVSLVGLAIGLILLQAGAGIIAQRMIFSSLIGTALAFGSPLILQVIKGLVE